MLDDQIIRFKRMERDCLDDLVYGKETIFERNAKRKTDDERFGDLHLCAFVPGYFLYMAIKNDLKDPELTTTQRIIHGSFYLGCELFLDAVRVGAFYGLYLFENYLSKS